MSPGPPKPTPHPTTRRNEVEQARRTGPVQAVRAQLKTLAGDDEAIRMLAEALRRMLHRS
jgi:hypothetical protein